MRRTRVMKILTLTIVVTISMSGPAYAFDNMMMRQADTEVIYMKEAAKASKTAENPIETDDLVETEAPVETEVPAETEEPVETETQEETMETEIPGETDVPSETETMESVDETKVQESETEIESKTETETEMEVPEEPEEYIETPDYLTEEEFAEVSNRMRYSTKVPIEGMPAFITQEMVSGALKCQEEYGYPASVTIAQIILESGFGAYGSGGDKDEGLTRLAFEYCNLFEMRGKGTAGSVTIDADEIKQQGTIPAGILYKAYHTYSESIEDRSKCLKRSFEDLLTGAENADVFAVRLGSRWSADKAYGLNLIKVMRTYDLYRLDELTLEQFSSVIGQFANPCPGSHITSTFGYREFDQKEHLGLDLATNSQNIPTYAVEDGVVTYVGYGKSSGNMIVIDHGNGMVTKYMHHAEMYVTVGQTVIKGQQIGLTGTTGHSTGVHLHFQVEINGETVDPLIYLKDGGSGELIKMREAVPAELPAFNAADVPGLAMGKDLLSELTLQSGF